MNDSRVILFGGNGFVGTAIAKELVMQNAKPVCVSRTGSMPVQLQKADWAHEVEWVQGDALNINPELLENASAVVALIGSPPVPTFSEKAYQQQLMMNSEPNLEVIKAVSNSNVARLVLLGAHLPKAIRTDKFAYAKGKRLCAAAARAFAEKSDQHAAVVLKPTAIYGIRYSQSGKAINVGAIMRPIAAMQNLLPNSLSSYLPETLVSVDAVASAAAGACLQDKFAGKFTVLTNQQIVDYL